GGILTHYAHNKNIAGTIVNGCVRDKNLFKKYDYPVYAAGVIPKTGKNRVIISAQKCSLTIAGVDIHVNDILFADCNGVLVIPRNQIEQVLQMTQNIAINERKIIEAIDTGKSLKE